jgi:NAD(P)-dependent dehydrogenase (short-subunit alcohol dehydrogenase family)
MPFDQSTVLVTGVGREGQAGEVVARAFAARGAVVLLVDRTAASVEARALALRDAGYRAFALPADLTDPAAVAKVAAHVRDEHGNRLHALVNLAGGFAMSGPVAESDIGVWDHQIAINLTTAFLATRALLPALRAARGAIVFFASASVLPGASAAKMSAYAVAKSGVLTLMRSVADEEAQNGVRANAVAPTVIRTAQNVQTMGSNVRYVEREAVADACVYLCSEAASAVTGQVLRLS